MEHANNDAYDLGLSIVDYIMLKEKYVTTALTSEKTFEAVDLDIDAEDCLEFKENIDDIHNVKMRRGK